MIAPVIVRVDQKSRGSIRGTICSPGNSASSGMAHLNSEKPTCGHSLDAREHLRIESALVRGRALLSEVLRNNPARSFSGDPRIQPSKQSFRGVFQSFHVKNAPELQSQLTTGASACPTQERSDPTQNRARV